MKMRLRFQKVTEQVQRGFTLVELLVVIAILGVLATAVIVALDPIQQLARGRDSGTVSSVAQISNALQAYYTSQGSTWPTASASWLDTLANSGEVKNKPTIPAGNAFNASLAGTSATCVTNNATTNRNICYTVDASNNALVWAILSSKSSYTRAGCTASTTFSAPMFVWDSSQGKAGYWCATGTTAPNTAAVVPAAGLILRE